MTDRNNRRAWIASLAAFLACLPVAFFVGITLIGHARPLPYVSTFIDRLILAAALLGLPSLAAFGAYRFVSRGERSPVARLLAWGIATPVVLASGAFAVFYAHLYLESAGREREMARTRVSDVRDEPIVSREGRPIGLRLSFVAELSSARRAFETLPQLYAGDGSDRLGMSLGVPGLSLDPKRGQVDGGAAFRLSGLGQPDIGPGRHEFVIDLYPHVVQAGAEGEPCLSSLPAPQLPPGSPPMTLRVEIAGTPYGNASRGGRRETTHHGYDVVEMYRAVLAGAVKPCPGEGPK